MKIVQINATCGNGSTGKICTSISKLLSEKQIENYILYCSGNSDDPLGIKCADARYLKFQALKARLFGNWGFNSIRSTKAMLCELERIQPDIVHLHNIHGHDCNLKLLFSYFRRKKTKIYWTFHDCWAFTGYCTHFDYVQCGQWKEGCRKCPQKHHYSWFFDNCRWLYGQKKELFQGLDLTIITPSDWLADLVQASFLKDYPVHVIRNGIDLRVFQPTKGDFRKKYHLEEKYIVLGVAFGWGERKGLDVFAALAKRLGSKYQIVLVGTDEKTDKQMPDNIISIHRTQNQSELAEIYTAVDVFVNPTREEVLGLVNLEALACGTPGVTFRTGGSPECYDAACGSVVEKEDISALEREIQSICEHGAYTKEACLKQASAFSAETCFREYLKLYGVLQ